MRPPPKSLALHPLLLFPPHHREPHQTHTLINDLPTRHPVQPIIPHPDIRAPLAIPLGRPQHPHRFPVLVTPDQEAGVVCHLLGGGGSSATVLQHLSMIHIGVAPARHHDGEGALVLVAVDPGLGIPVRPVAHGADLQRPPCTHVEPIVPDPIGSDSEGVGGLERVGRVGRQRRRGIAGLGFEGFGAEDAAE